MGKADLTNRDIYGFIDALAPFETCEGWDNSGLLAGTMDRAVRGVYCALDMSMRVLEDALEKGANLIVTHHPILFGGRKNLREDDAEGQMLCRMVRENVSLISAHTNFDKADGGVNDVLASRLGLRNVSRIETDEEGFVRIGETDPVMLSVFTEKVRRVLGDAVRTYGDGGKLLRRVAVCGGAGGEFAKMCCESGADVYVTGEMRYHDSLDLAQCGFATMQVGHDASEKIAVEELKKLIETKVRDAGSDVPVFLSDTDLFSLRAI